MNIFDYQENIFKIEDRFLNFEIQHSQYHSAFDNYESEFELQVWENGGRNSCELESIKNFKSTHKDSMCERNYSSSDECVLSLIPFVEGDLDLKILEKLVSHDIQKRGYNATVVDCLDMWDDESNNEEKDDIIRKKQSKSKAQIKALKVEYKKKRNWNK